VGIGRELALVFARNRYDLVLVARNEQQLREVAGRCEAEGGGKARVLVKDLSVQQSAQEIFDELQADNTRVDVLVNNAGFGNWGLFAGTDLDADVRLLNVNIVALTALTKLFVRPMIERRNGRILNVASTAAFQPGPRMATYYASKAYVLHFTEAIAQELAGSGVTVTALCPGPTRTEFGTRAGVQGTRLFRNHASDAASVARAGYEGMMRGRRVVIPGVANRILSVAAQLAPRAMVTWAAGKLNETH